VAAEVAVMLHLVPEHQRVLMEVRASLANALLEGARILQRQKRANREMVGTARRMLEAQRATNRQAVREHTRIFRAVVEQMQAEARNYKVIYMQAKSASLSGAVLQEGRLSAPGTRWPHGASTSGIPALPPRSLRVFKVHHLAWKASTRGEVRM
jgi:hypothetical protein